jgi:hypothetical protein
MSHYITPTPYRFGPAVRAEFEFLGVAALTVLIVLLVLAGVA